MYRQGPFNFIWMKLTQSPSIVEIKLITLSEERNRPNKVKRQQIITSHYTEQSKPILYFIFISRRLLFKFDVNRNIKVDFKIDCQTSVSEVKMKGKKFF